MIKTISTIIVILFCWIIYPYKWIRHFQFVNRKSKAIRQAKELQKTTDKKVMVIQIGSIFKIGVNTELKRYDKLARKILRVKRCDNFIWNYKNAVIYSAK